jgi:hypothetical protein
MNTLKLFSGGTVLIISLFLSSHVRAETSINFDDPGLGPKSSIVNFYDGVTFNGIANNISNSGGPYPVTEKVPSPLDDAVTWSHKSSAQAGGSGANLAVGLTSGLPSKAGILMTFKHNISGLTVTGLDYGPSEAGDGTDMEEMTLAAYDAAGNLIGQKHFTKRIPKTNAIIGTLTFKSMKYVTFNYTSTNGFFGIDDLSYSVEKESDPFLIADKEENICDSYEKFVRPNTSLYQFGEKLGGQKKKYSVMLKTAEDMFIMHLVACEKKWTFNSALKWHSERERLARLIIEIEKLFILSFTGTGFNDEENKIFERAYSNSAKLKRAIGEEKALYKNYIKILKQFEDRKYLYTYPDASTRLLILDLLQKAEKAYTKWEKKSLEVHKMQGIKIKGKKTAYRAREERGFYEMMTKYPKIKFNFTKTASYHTKNQLISTSSAVEKLLGKKGIHIYKKENNRRRATNPKKNQ